MEREVVMYNYYDKIVVKFMEKLYKVKKYK